MLAYIMGDKEEGDRMTEKALALLETGHKRTHACRNAGDKGMLQHKSNPAQAYLANHEAYRIAKLNRGELFAHSIAYRPRGHKPHKQEAATYLSELRELAGSIGDASLYERIAHCAAAVNEKAE